VPSPLALNIGMVSHGKPGDGGAGVRDDGEQPMAEGVLVMV
jgi:hypothetical protein